MWWSRKNTRRSASTDDPEVIEVLQEITDRLNATSLQLKNFSSDLQTNINTLRRYAITAEKRVQGSK